MLMLDLAASIANAKTPSITVTKSSLRFYTTAWRSLLDDPSRANPPPPQPNASDPRVGLVVERVEGYLPSHTQCRTGNWSPQYQRMTEPPVPTFYQELSAQSQASPKPWLGTESPVLAACSGFSAQSSPVPTLSHF
jgi:hypothetical protein